MIWRLDRLLGAGSGRRTGVWGNEIFLEAGIGRELFRVPLSSDVLFRLLALSRQQKSSSMTVLVSSSLVFEKLDLSGEDIRALAWKRCSSEILR